MAIIDWTLDPVNEITNTTKIKDADNKIQSTMTDLSSWVNSDGVYTASGLKQEFGVLEDDLTASINSVIEDTIVTEW